MKDKTDITIILDRSGSMESVKSDTIGGFNSFLGEQQKVENEASISLVQFDDQYEIVYSDKDINSADKLTESTFQPRGMTALYDAIGRTINSVGQRLTDLAESERPDTVVFVILTDGFENASREFSAVKINEMINHQRNNYKWEFIFIGANQDAVLSAEAIGINANAALTYAANAEGTAEAFSSVAKNVAKYRMSKVSASLNFSDDDRKKQEDAMKPKK
ncbi:MAG: vWA domain-containing protein [Aridibacter sp.]